MEFVSKIDSTQFNTREIERASEKFGLCQDVIKLLFARGVDTEEFARWRFDGLKLTAEKREEKFPENSWEEFRDRILAENQK